MKRFHWVAVSVSMILSGFVFLPGQQKSGLSKPLARARTFSTGMAQVSADTVDIGNLVEHSLQGAQYPNGLYQTFFGLHYESMGPDSLLHSSVARTHGQEFPGDRSDWIVQSRRFRSGAEADTYSVVDFIEFLETEQVLIVPKDSGRAIGVEFIFHVTLDSGDTIKNAAMVFGYDADLGSPTGGYGDDESEAILSDSLKILYGFDASEDLFTGLSYRSGGRAMYPGNILGFHQTVNRQGAPSNVVDSVLIEMIQSPLFDVGIGIGDVSLYWVVSLGDYADTLSDTVRFSLVNGRSRDDIRSANLQRRDVRAVAPGPFLFELSENFPNPFNPVTTITYRLEESGDIDISVFNLMGQKVRTLVRGRVESGRHVVIWNGRDDEGRLVSSGVYLYRLHGERHSITRKMMLLK